jgi:hypothetical protein
MKSTAHGSDISPCCLGSIVDSSCCMNVDATSINTYKPIRQEITTSILTLGFGGST